MKKRLLVIMSMAVVMLVGATIAASADTQYLEIWNGSDCIDVTDADKQTGTIGAGSYSYDASTTTLTISNLNLSTEKFCIAARYFDSLTINVSTDCHFSSTGLSESIPILAEDCNKLIITGTGKLSLEGAYGINICNEANCQLFINGANIDIVAKEIGIVAGDCFFNGKCNVSVLCKAWDDQMGILTAGKLVFQLEKGGKVDLKVTNGVPIAACGGIQFGDNNAITSPKGAKIISPEDQKPEDPFTCDGYAITDADGNFVEEATIESVETGSVAGVNTADNAPMIIFAAMAMLVILGTTTVLLKKQR